MLWSVINLGSKQKKLVSQVSLFHYRVRDKLKSYQSETNIGKILEILSREYLWKKFNYREWSQLLAEKAITD